MKQTKKPHISGFSWNIRKTIILVVSAILIGLWGFFYSWVVVKYGHQYAISISALLVASIAAVGTLLSLKWTRETIRPFLSFSGDVKVDKTQYWVTLTFTIENSGSLPASDIYTEIDFFNENEEVTKDNLSSKYPPLKRRPEVTMVFPNKPTYANYALDLRDIADKELWQDISNGKVTVRLRIRYKNMSKEYITIQTEKVEKLEQARQVQLIPSFPQKWK